MGSTIDDEHVGQPHYPWPWAHAPAMMEARGIDLVAAADDDPAKLEDFKRRWGSARPCTPTTGRWWKRKRSTWSA